MKLSLESPAGNLERRSPSYLSSHSGCWINVSLEKSVASKLWKLRCCTCSFFPTTGSMDNRTEMSSKATSSYILHYYYHGKRQTCAIFTCYNFLLVLFLYVLFLHAIFAFTVFIGFYLCHFSVHHLHHLNLTFCPDPDPVEFPTIPSLNDPSYP